MTGIGITDPKNLHAAWAERFNARDMEGMLALAEPGSVFAPQPGMVVAGDGYRAALQQFLGLRLPITIALRRHVVADDIALLIADWSIKGTDPEGNPVDMSGTATDVARKGPEGWLFVIDNPFGTI